MVLGRVELTLDLEWHSGIFRHIFTFQVHTVQCVKSTLSLVGSQWPPFAIGTHSDQYYDAPKKTLCLWRALPVPKDCEESNHVNVLNWATPPCSKSTFKQYGGWLNTLQIRVIFDQYEKENQKKKRKLPAGLKAATCISGGSGVLFPAAPLYIPHIYTYSIQYSMLYLTHIGLHYIAFQIPHPYTRCTYYISPVRYARSWHLLSEW